mgnify:FL=1
MEENDNINEPKSWKWWLFAIVICLLIWCGGYILTKWLSGCSCIFQVDGETSPSALFGDSFGGVNALVSALAFAGMIVTFAFQRYELGLQRQELKAQREEFSAQNVTLRLQRFENTFFNMMELQQSIVNDLYAEEANKRNVLEDASDGSGRFWKEEITQYQHKGRDLFHYAFMVVEHMVKDDTPQGHNVNGLYCLLYEKGLKSFDEYYTVSLFDHYFRHLYTILKFIDQNDWLGENEQYKYATFLRATLSRYELVMLYYNGFFYAKMKRLMEKYHLLNNLRTDLLTLTQENYIYLQGLDKHAYDDAIKAGFSGRDFEMYLTDSKEDNTKYYLGAFYTNKEIERGKAILDRWNKFVASKV